MSCLGAVAGQELLIAPRGEDPESLVPDLALPPMPDAASDADDHPMDAEGNEGQIGESEGHFEEYVTTPYSDDWESGEYFGQNEPYLDDEFQMMQCDDPVLESTGTWIRRGFWYAEVDAVIFNRKWTRDAITLIQQPVGISSSVFINTTVDNQLRLNGSKPGAEGVPRFTLGHFLFRDHKNRDHVVEFTAYGGGEWSQDARLKANPDNELGTTTLSVPVVVSGGNQSFSGADSSQFRYDSRFNSFELNYHVKDRMGRDHMEMEPSGRWVRRAGPSISRSLLAGIRYFDMNEDFDWEAFDVDVDGDGTPDGDGYTSIRADNDMIGTQLGFSWGYETARWSGGVRTKGGMFLNLIDATTDTLVPNIDEPVSITSALQGDEMSFIGEAALQGKWHLRPNFSIRAAMEILFVSSIAAAPDQVTGSFIPGGPSAVNSASDATYLGGSIGFEGYW